MMKVEDIISSIAMVIEVFGIMVIVLGLLWGSLQFVINRLRHQQDAFSAYRRKIGHSILLGLELLVAADIIDTVTIDPTLDSVIVLGLIVLIRTFLSFSIEIELEGVFPWRRRGRAEDR